ncbi:MAG: NTP transferase domain-containing protein [Candidatus Kapaibacterium sp.]|jgi:choline kinase
MKKSDVIILAASPSSYNIYTPLMKVKRKTLIHNLVKKISNNPNVNKIIVVGGHNFEELKRALSDVDVHFVYNKNYSNGICSSIKAGVASVESDSLMVMHGDLWFKNLQISKILKNQKSLIVATECRHMKAKEIGIRDYNGQLLYFGWRQKLKWGKIFYIHQDFRQIFENVLYNNSTGNWFSFEILGYMLKAGCSFEILNHKNSLFDIDCYQDLRKIIL